MQTLLSPVPPVALSSTATVGKFATALNYAEPSPDGRWLCALCDAVTQGTIQVCHYISATLVAQERDRVA
jgi:hypothetical protein